MFTGPRTTAARLLVASIVAGGMGWLGHQSLAAEPAATNRDRAQELTDASYVQLRDQVRPTPDELAWQKIPWRTSVWDGIVEAQSSDKPTLIWIMNGHPLACT